MYVAAVSLAIPADPALRGAAFSGQAVVLDAAGMAGGLALSNGRRAVVGS